MRWRRLHTQAPPLASCDQRRFPRLCAAVLCCISVSACRCFGAISQHGPVVPSPEARTLLHGPTRGGVGPRRPPAPPASLPGIPGAAMVGGLSFTPRGLGALPTYQSGGGSASVELVEVWGDAWPQACATCGFVGRGRCCAPMSGTRGGDLSGARRPLSPARFQGWGSYGARRPRAAQFNAD